MYRTIASWAAEIGSRAMTHRGRVAAIRRWIAQHEPVSGRPVARGEIDATAIAPELRMLGVDRIATDRRSIHAWMRVARCLRSGRYMQIDPHLIPHPSCLFGRRTKLRSVYVIPGSLPPQVHGHSHSFRWRGKWKTAPGSYVPSRWIGLIGEANWREYLSAPGTIGHPAALEQECARFDRRGKVYRRWRWTGDHWCPAGVAIPMPSDMAARYGRYEHGEDVAACMISIARKRASVAISRAARLLARLGHRIRVSAADVHGAGACWDGIVSWCCARQIDHRSTTVSLRELWADSRARPYALAVAQRIIMTRRNNQ